MRYIYKFNPLKEPVIKGPIEKVLSLKKQNETTVVYCLIRDTMQRNRTVTFRPIETGAYINDESLGGYTFLDTIMYYDDSYVLHWFYKIE